MWVIKSLTAVALVLFVATATLVAQEHPEHPTKAEKPAEASITIAKLADAIAQYVANDAKLKGGYFLVYDTVQDKTLQLSLAKVHTDKLAGLGNDVYFACADFNSADDHLYDLDIFMKQSDDGLQVSDISIHKMDGNARYTWAEKDGTWEKVYSEDE